MENDLYPMLDLPPLDIRLLKRGLDVQTRIFYANSIPGNRAEVVRFWAGERGVWVRCKYGTNLSGQSILKTMPANVLCLVDIAAVLQGDTAKEVDKLPTLEQQRENGSLAPLPHVRLRAQLAFADRNNASDLMRAGFSLIERVRAYYDVVGYCAPTMLFRDRGAEYPRAYAAALSHDKDGFYRKAISVKHPSDGVKAVWGRAGMLCLETAFDVAEWELGQAFPESTDTLHSAKWAALAACQNHEFSGVYWKSSRRRLGTKGIRKMIDATLAGLHGAYLIVRPETGIASFQPERLFNILRPHDEKCTAQRGKVFQYARQVHPQAA